MPYNVLGYLKHCTVHTLFSTQLCSEPKNTVDIRSSDTVQSGKSQELTVLTGIMIIHQAGTDQSDGRMPFNMSVHPIFDRVRMTKQSTIHQYSKSWVFKEASERFGDLAFLDSLVVTD